MANDYLTFLEIAKMNADSAIIPLIEKDIVLTPELDLIPFDTIDGTSYKTLLRTSLPTATFRDPNTGAEIVTSRYENKLVETKYLDVPLEIDVALTSASEKGEAYALALEEDGGVKAAMKKMGLQFFYGTGTGGDAAGFPGAVQMVDSSCVVDATGTTEDTCTSVYALKLGNDSVQGVMGKGGKLGFQTWFKQRVVRSSKSLTAWCNNLEGWYGVQWVAPYSIGRIKKVTEDSGKGMTDKLISKLLVKMMVKGVRPDVLLMNGRSIGQLQESRTATNPTGVPAPFPDSAFGIPIVVTNSILNTEKLAL